MEDDYELEEQLIAAWIRLTGTLKNTRITHGMIYNEAIVLSIAYARYKKDGTDTIPFKEIASETRMLKSLVNRTVDSLEKKGLVERIDGQDKRTTNVRLVKEKLDVYLEMHAHTLEMVRGIVQIVGRKDAEAFVRIAKKISDASQA